MRFPFASVILLSDPVEHDQTKAHHRGQPAWSALAATQHIQAHEGLRDLDTQSKD